MLKNFRTYDLAKELYQEGVKVKTNHIIKNQLHRALLSIVLNLAEGSGKTSFKDQCRFYLISLGSTRECMAVFDLIDQKQLYKQADTLAAHTWKLIKALQKSPAH